MTRLNRRNFVQRSTTLAVASGLMVHSSARGAAANKLRTAFIGVGGRGGGNLNTVARDPGVEVVALCDVNRNNLAAAQKQFTTARTYVDFRELYKQADDIDAVVVSVAEHTHAYATLPALRMGKHVYCEKPLTYNIAESRIITAAAAESDVATQMGTQIHATDNYHRVVELIQSGAIGPVREAHVWVGRSWGLQSKEDAERFHDPVFVTERPSEVMPIPDYLEWDLWLGPAPERPFNSVYFPGPAWYRWWDFGNGTMSDLGSHWNDLPFWALKLDAPLSVHADGAEPHPEIAPASMKAVYQYAARSEMPACQLTWYQGKYKPPQWHDGSIPKFDSGVLFVGDDGMLLSDYGKHLLLPEEKFVDFKPPAPFIPDVAGHHEDWLAACRTGSPTGSPFSYAGPLTEANHLGNVAFRCGSPIQWDAANMRAIDNPAAAPFISRTPREGWSLNT